MANNNDEEIPYLNSSADVLRSVKEDTTFTKDEEEQSTLRRVYNLLREGVDDLDKWHAFDLNETELKLKQQVKAHQIAADILSPILDAITQAIATVDEKFKQRNTK